MSTVSASRVPSKYAYSHNGELIYQRRRERGLTQEQLAKKLDVDVKTVRRWEIGDVNFGMVSIYTAWRIATVLGLDFGVFASPDGAGEDPLFFGTCVPHALDKLSSIDYNKKAGRSAITNRIAPSFRVLLLY